MKTEQLERTWIKVSDELPPFYVTVEAVDKYGHSFDVYAVACEETGEFLGFKRDANDSYYTDHILIWKPFTPYPVELLNECIRELNEGHETV